MPKAERFVSQVRFGVGLLAAAALALALAACGGGGGSPSTPSPNPPPGGGGGGGTTITIASSGVSPKELTVSIGSRVTFVNNDSRAHEMNSDPHPEHTGCPEINVGFLQSGQSRETQNLVSAKTCSYHDHNQESNESLKGRIIIR